MGEQDQPQPQATVEQPQAETELADAQLRDVAGGFVNSGIELGHGFVGSGVDLAHGFVQQDVGI